MGDQLSIFDFLDNPKNELPLGYIHKDAEQHVGKEIPFRELENYIGKKVLCEMPAYNGNWYKVVIITSYHKDCDKVYGDGEEPIGVCDRIGYTDDNRTKNENSWVSEHFIRNGRYHDPEAKFLECFYELKE